MYNADRQKWNERLAIVKQKTHNGRDCGFFYSVFGKVAYTSGWLPCALLLFNHLQIYLTALQIALAIIPAITESINEMIVSCNNVKPPLCANFENGNAYIISFFHSILNIIVMDTVRTKGYQRSWWGRLCWVVKEGADPSLQGTKRILVYLAIPFLTEWLICDTIICRKVGITKWHTCRNFRLALPPEF